jgi:hypothetical protein
MQRDLDQILMATRGLAGGTFDPLTVIRSVNALHPLGKEGALDAIQDFVQRHRSEVEVSHGMFLVLRCLFEIPTPPGYMPRMLFGQPTPDEPQDPTLVPCFPLVLLSDIPLQLVRGWDLFGAPQDIKSHLSYFRRQGRLRVRPLMPTNRPLDVLSRLEKSPQWLWGKQYRTSEGILWKGASTPATAGRAMIRTQLLRLIATVYPTNLDSASLHRLWEPNRAEANWQRILTEVSRLDLRWEEARQDFARK